MLLLITDDGLGYEELRVPMAIGIALTFTSPPASRQVPTKLKILSDFQKRCPEYLD